MDREQAIKLMQDLLRRVVERKGSDLFITAGFPPAVKIDGEVRPQSERRLTPEESAVLVRSIIELGRNLGLRVTAEGVETATVHQTLRELGCDFAQGFHISRPIPADECHRLLEAITHAIEPQ